MFREKGISKKICAVVCSLVMALSLLGAGITMDTITANADGVVTAKITYTAQFDGAFQDVKLSIPVASDTAERYGYEDAVAPSTGVSLLDVWVQVHADLYPEFSQVNREEYFAIGDGQYGKYITNALKKGGMNCGYCKNGSSSVVLSTKVENNDVVDVWYNQKEYPNNDRYSHFIDVNYEDGYLSGKLVRDEYDANYQAVPTPLSGIELGFLNPDTLEIVPVSTFGSTKTSEDGSFSVEMPSSSINYMLTILDGAYEGTPLVRTLCVAYTTAAMIDTAAMTPEEELEVYNAAGKYLAENNKSIVYGDNKEGYLLGLGRSGYPVSSNLYQGYYDSVKAQIAGNNNNNNNNNYKASNMKMAVAPSNGYFDSVTECAKVVVALNAIGYDPTSIDGVDITPQLSDVDNVDGTWGYAYALIALDTKNYPSSAREIYVSKLLEEQLDNGSWGWDGESADVDTTGIVLAALAPYYNSNTAVKNAVDKSLEFLSAAQMPDGTFTSGMNENANSTAMVVLGLSALGINPDTDSRFIKNGVSVVDALCSFAVKGGGFGWMDNVEVNDYATYQSYYSACSYFRLINGMNGLFDMTPERNAAAETAQPTIKVSSVPKTGDALVRFL